ncbi:MAG: DUF362 domain-containing protein [Synergistaceae bacterium]|nr:DUF362 domain-containing protein [Synergistaceae bacterium]
MFNVAITHADNYRLDTVKAALRRCFDSLGLPGRNPLGSIIQPGNTVFIKPNWVASRWRESCPHRDNLYCVITHPAVIEAVCGYAAEALNGKGRIIIGDNPSIDADFEELMSFTAVRERLMGKYGCELEIKDLRPLVCDDLKNYGKKSLMIPQSGDDRGTVQVNLGRESLFYGTDPSKFRGVFDEREDTIASHTGDTQLYTYSRSLYDADVYISVPKLKTHQKVGATLNLKGLVGAVSDKNQLVHWQIGYPENGGDEYPSRGAYEAGSKAKVKHRGAWPGNDTIWRMVVDLWHGMAKRRRKYFTVIDGITAGEGQGPFCPTSKNANTLIAADNLIASDIAAVRYMGFDPVKINYLRYFLEGDISLDDINVILDGRRINDFFVSGSKYLDFLTVPQWECIKIPPAQS